VWPWTRPAIGFMRAVPGLELCEAPLWCSRLGVAKFSRLLGGSGVQDTVASEHHSTIWLMPTATASCAHLGHTRRGIQAGDKGTQPMGGCYP
jgi:hypothetical protein